MPTISPETHLEVDGLKARAERIPGFLVDRFHREAHFTRLARRKPAFVQVRANHHARELRIARAEAGCAVPTSLPPRSTVAVWQSARISSSLWLM